MSGSFSAEMFRLFRDALHDIFGLFDLIWIGLAGAAAWIGLQADDAEAGDGGAAGEPVPAGGDRSRRRPSRSGARATPSTG